MFAAHIHNSLDIVVRQHTLAIVGQDDPFGRFNSQFKTFHTLGGYGGGNSLFAFAVKADDLLLLCHYADFLRGRAVGVLGYAVNVYFFIA